MSFSASSSSLKSIAVWSAKSIDDFEALGRLLRYNGQWLNLKLADLPTREMAKQEIGVCYPFGRRKVKLEGTLVLGWDGTSSFLVGALLDYGWESSFDRTRIVEWIGGPEFYGRGVPAAVGHAIVRLLFEERRAYALRIRSQSDFLGAFREVGPLPALEEKQGDGWLHFSKSTGTSLGRLEMGSWPHHIPRAITPSHLRTLQPIRRRATGGGSHVDVQVRDPSHAHLELLKGCLPQRSFFFPKRGGVEEVDNIIIGAGISGLTANYCLKSQRNVVLEFNDRIGGTAAAGQGKTTPFPLGAHYEHDVMPYFGEELIDLLLELELIEAMPGARKFTFVDRHHYVQGDIREEQHISRDGYYYKSIWPLLLKEDVFTQFNRRIFPFVGQSTLPSRLVSEEMKAMGNETFEFWLKKNGLALPVEVKCAMEQAMRSDYGASSSVISAFAGVHYFTCRPYMSDQDNGVGTFSPPEGLSYFANKLHGATPDADIRLRHLVRNVVDRVSHVEVRALDLERRETRVFRAKNVVYASPKKTLKYTYPAAAKLFARNAYAAWITVTMEFAEFPAQGALKWSSGAYEPTETYVGMTWVNHNARSELPVVTHYLAFAPGRLEHLRALLSKPKDLIHLCLQQLELLLGANASKYLRSVVIQKLGHAMPTPVPESLFIEPNKNRPSPRIVFAGVDTGRLPLVSEALDSGIVAAKALLDV